MNPSRLLPLALLALSACISTAPKIQLPSRAIADCESRSVKQTAIGSIVASTDDVVREGTYPGDAPLMKLVKSGGGVFAYWTNQPLRVPRTAKHLGASGDYLTLNRAVITNQINTADHWRPVWLTFATPKGDVTVLERAYDIQNVCIEGQRSL
ncbi:MAG TPA: hypothetical protein VGY57_12045 [Vicinamibacterales bacterium]|nr:hypothetical protein [Vicinamibacterales bacterium]